MEKDILNQLNEIKLQLKNYNIITMYFLIIKEFCKWWILVKELPNNGGIVVLLHIHK